MCCQLLDHALARDCRDSLVAVLVRARDMPARHNTAQIGLPALPVPRASIAHPDFFKPDG